MDLSWYTAVTTLIHVILYFTFPTKPYHATPSTIVTKLYSNSMMVIFNSRIRVVGGRDDRSDLRLPISFGGKGQVGHSATLEARAAAELGTVHVQEEVWVHSDTVEMKAQVSSHFESIYESCLNA